jgi:Domain of unknown function DUF488
MIYTIGYATLTQSKLLAIAELLEATVIDVRSIPRSRKAGFSKSALTALLGKRYEHIPSLGGKPFKPPKRALDALKERTDNVILMCVEDVPTDCHRFLLGELLDCEVWHIWDGKLFEQKPLQAMLDAKGEDCECYYVDDLEAIYKRKEAPIEAKSSKPKSSKSAPKKVTKAPKVVKRARNIKVKA